MDGVILRSNDINEVYKVEKCIKARNNIYLKLYPAEIINISHIGIGSRACIDTVEILAKDEGILVGSTSFGGILICSETHFLPFMETRPFRVNAGAVHSYIWSYKFDYEKEDTITYYITELKAGSKVLVVNTKGRGRLVSVGRVKIERRPLILIETIVHKDGNDYYLNVIVQDDWHVRIFDYNGKVRSVTELKIGDKLAAFIDKPGRHTGIKIDEFILEK